jgi:hypothetical protein
MVSSVKRELCSFLRDYTIDGAKKQSNLTKEHNLAETALTPMDRPRRRLLTLNQKIA